MTTSRDGGRPVMRVGLLRPRGHCTFSWQEPERGGRRDVEVRPNHCDACVAQLQELGYHLVFVEAETETETE